MMLAPFWTLDARATLLHADALDGLRAIPDASIHCIVSSPPYFGLRDYGLPRQVWGGDPNCDHQWETIWVANQNTGGGVSRKQATNRGSFSTEPRRDGGPLPVKVDGPRGHHSDFCALCGAWKGCLGLEPLHCCGSWAMGEEPCSHCYICHVRMIFRELWRVLRTDGTIWWNMGDSYAGSGGAGGDYAPGGLREGQPRYQGTGKQLAGGRGRRGPSGKHSPDCGIPEERSNRFAMPGLKPKDLMGMPWRTALALQADGWWLRSDIVWAKGNPMPESVRDRPTRSHEYIFLFTKSQQYYYDMDAIREPHAEDSKARVQRGHHRTGHKWEDGPGSQTIANDLSQALHPSGRNRRTVWQVNTKPFKGAHFATFPPGLVEPCILAGTSERGCCPSCGAPYARVVEKGEPLAEWQASCGADENGEYHGQAQKEYEESGVQNASDVKARILAGMRERRTVAWSPACNCDAGEPIPCTVLDPFNGSGTTGAVALQHGRRYIGIDLNPEYLQLAVDRITRAATEPPKPARKKKPKATPKPPAEPEQPQLLLPLVA